MIYLWDTDICVYFLNGNNAISSKAKEVGIEEICTTIITIAELKFGAYNSAKVGANLKRIEALQESMLVFTDINNNVVDMYAQNKALLKKQGIVISDFDLVIASFAIENELIVVTNNIKHYSQISNLRVENWLNE